MVPEIVDAFLAGEDIDRFHAHARLATFLSRIIEALPESGGERSVLSVNDDGANPPCRTFCPSSDGA